MTAATLTPRERAYRDALWEATQQGLRGEEALAYADAMRSTAWFAAAVVGYAARDCGRALLAALPGRRS